MVSVSVKSLIIGILFFRKRIINIDPVINVNKYKIYSFLRSWISKVFILRIIIDAIHNINVVAKKVSMVLDIGILKKFLK